MVDPLKNMMDLQKALLDGWLASANQMMEYWKHVLDLQDRLIHHATAGRDHIEIDTGPSFVGKYGKRRFDIDPEHDV